MPGPDSRKRIARWLLAGLLGVLLVSSPWWGIALGRRLSWLEIERVEISGLRLLAPHEVLEISGIREGQHLLDDPAGWESALEAHPVIAQASITRRVPNALRIRIAEKRAVGFVEGDPLRAATGSGEILPIDLATVPLDLPIIRGSFADSLGELEMRAMLAETERLQEIDPEFVAEISELRSFEAGAGSILLAHSEAELLLPLGVPAERIAQLRAVLQHLEQHRRLEGDLAPGGARPRLDLRFDAQIVVGSSSARERS